MEDVVAAMDKVFSDAVYRNKIAAAGMEFATKYTWDTVLNEWDSIFMQYEVPFAKPMRMEAVA